jgi:hypothetical protein
VLSTRFGKFLGDESGGYTIWSLIWFSLYVAMGGLAVDMTDAYRTQTLLQSTADAAALAGVMSLPDEIDAVVQARDYASNNMNPAINGLVLDDDEVIVGNWDFTTRSFSTGGVEPDAVFVITRRDDQNANPLATNFLRILSLWGLPLDHWNIRTEAIAVRYVPSCLRGGFVAGNSVDMRGGNGFYNNICIHGQNVIEDNGQDNAVDIQNGNYYEDGVQVSMPDFEGLPNRANLCDQNAGLCDATTEGDLWPKDSDIVGQIVAGLADTASGYVMPDFMYPVDANGDLVIDPLTGFPAGPGDPVIITGAENYAGTYDPYTVYDMRCSQANKQIDLPTDTTISNVVIVSNCRIHSSSGLKLQDVVLASSYVGPKASIHIAANSTLGDARFCDPASSGGGVEIYTPGDVHIAAQGEWYGLRIVSGRDVKITSRNAGINGISVQAKNNIDLGSVNDFGLCPGSPGWNFTPQYRLVQ